MMFKGSKRSDWEGVGRDGKGSSQQWVYEGMRKRVCRGGVPAERVVRRGLYTDGDKGTVLPCVASMASMASIRFERSKGG